jgi:hypothetical protein
MSREPALRDLVGDTLAAEGLAGRLDSASGIFVFGSQAAGVARGTSDIDILAVGTGEDMKSPALDLVWVPESRIESPQWLHSELGTHIAKYGVCLKGDSDWTKLAKVVPATAERKWRRLRDVAVLLHDGSPIHPTVRGKYETRARRELQRYELLKQGEAVAPTPLLDSEWQGDPDCRLRLLTLADQLGETDSALGQMIRNILELPQIGRVSAGRVA